MKKLYRLLKSNDFKSVLDKRLLVVKNDCFSFYYKNSELTHIRIGISVSNKIGDAVIRVKARRQIRAMISSIDKELSVYSLPYDVVIITRNGFIKNSYQDTYKDLSLAFSSLAKMRK